MSYGGEVIHFSPGVVYPLDAKTHHVIDDQTKYAIKNNQIENTFINKLADEYEGLYGFMEACIERFDMDDEDEHNFRRGFALSAVTIITQKQLNDESIELDLDASMTMIDYLLGEDEQTEYMDSDEIDDQVDQYVYASAGYLREHSPTLTEIWMQYLEIEKKQLNDVPYFFSMGIGIAHDIYMAQRLQKDYKPTSALLGRLVSDYASNTN